VTLLGLTKTKATGLVANKRIICCFPSHHFRLELFLLPAVTRYDAALTTGNTPKDRENAERKRK
jgi:hypothetical protein